MKRNFTLKEGFLLGGGLIIVGLLLHLTVGPVEWEAFAWPVNGIVLAGFLTLIAAVYLLRKKVSVSTYHSTHLISVKK